MNSEQRFKYFESGKLQQAVQIELLDWAGYWAEALPGEITDPLLLKQTKEAVNLILVDLGGVIRKVSRLAISYEVFKTAVPEGITDADIRQVVVNIMATKLKWITGIEALPEE